MKSDPDPGCLNNREKYPGFFMPCYGIIYGAPEVLRICGMDYFRLPCLRDIPVKTII